MKKQILILMLASAAAPLFAMDAPRAGYRVAILGWGSLIECPGAIPLEERNGFKTHGQTGPELPILYARKSGTSGDNPVPYLSLVIAPGLNAKMLHTFYATYNGTNLTKAIVALRIREKSENPDIIGYVNLKKGTYRRRDFNSTTKAISKQEGRFNPITNSGDEYYNNNLMLQRIVKWAKDKGYNAVIWTDLQPSFNSNEFTLQNLQAFLNQRGQGGLRKSYCYFRITPDAIRNGTRFGNQLMEYAADRMQNHFGENVRNLTQEECKRVVRTVQ